MPITGSCRIRCRCLLISSFRHLVVLFRPAFPACLRLISPLPFHLIVVSSYRLSPRPSVSPLFDTVGRGVRRGATVSCLLGFYPVVCADVDSWVIPYLPTFPLSACFVGSAAERWRSHLVRAGCAAMSCLPVGSPRLSSRSSSRRSGRFISSVSRPVLRHDGRGVGGCGATAACFRSSS